MKILFLLSISFCFLSLSCAQASVETVSSNTVQSAQIFQIYTIEASKSKTEIVATFRVGGATGTTLELSAPAKILHNKQLLPVSAPSSLIGTNYRMKGTDYRASFGNFLGAHEFSYTDASGKTHVTSIAVAPVEIIEKGAITLVNFKPAVIPLSRAVGADETLTVAFDSIIGGEVPTGGNTVYLNDKRNALVITPQYWSEKQLNPIAELQIKIKKSGNVSPGSTLGGSISAVYSAAPRSVNVKASAKTIQSKTRKKA